MRNVVRLAIVAAVCGSSAAAEDPGEDNPRAEIISYGPDGKPDRVRLDGYEYRLCKDGQTDSCINPQDAGFDWGGKEIDYWPGRPASEIEGPLPEREPETAPEPQPDARESGAP